MGFYRGFEQDLTGITVNNREIYPGITVNNREIYPGYERLTPRYTRVMRD